MDVVWWGRENGGGLSIQCVFKKWLQTRWLGHRNPEFKRQRRDTRESSPWRSVVPSQHGVVAAKLILVILLISPCERDREKAKGEWLALGLC